MFYFLVTLQAGMLQFKPFKCQYHKMVEHTKTIRRQITGELFECVLPFCGIGT